MRKTGFRWQIPDVTRIVWASHEIQEEWQPRFSAASRALQRAEYISVMEGFRPAALTTVSPDMLPETMARGREHGVEIVPLDRQSFGPQGSEYTTAHREPQPGEDWGYRTGIVAPGAVEAFREAYNSQEVEAKRRLGRLLGYPACCIDFFCRVWCEEDYIDTTWPMALGAEPAGEEKRVDVQDAPPLANILLRWFSVRAVPHLPCSFDCSATVEQARDYLRIIRADGRDQAADDIREALSWPVEWSALHGIAKIKTPVGKASAGTDPTLEKYTVRYHGDGYPEPGASGLGFPYRNQANVQLTETRSHKEMREAASPREWEDNGFGSRAAMLEAHNVLKQALQLRLDLTLDSAVDLGCGNGRLLEVLGFDSPHGVEHNPERAARARDRLPEGEFTVGDFCRDLEAWDGAYDLAIFMPGRALELEDADLREAVGRALRARADHLMVYAYGDWLERYDNFEGLAHVAGLGEEYEQAEQRGYVVEEDHAAAFVI